MVMAGVNDLKMHTARRGASPISVFRQLVSQGGIKFNFGVVAVELKEDDLRRIHDIIHEIDDRRAFYNAFEDEIPSNMVASVRSAKQKVHEIRSGIWANPWAREVVQMLLHDIGDFLTKIERQPLPRNFGDEGFDRFEEHALELRLRVWTAIAHLVVVFGDAVEPLHLPSEILKEVSKAYKARKF
jgi:hypothetical protein